jgi:hypothetical protein
MLIGQSIDHIQHWDLVVKLGEMSILNIPQNKKLVL